MDIDRLFDRLGIAAHNPAASTGVNGGWRAGGGRFVSENPATGKPLARGAGAPTRPVRARTGG